MCHKIMSEMNTNLQLSFLATDRGGGCYEYIGEMGQILGSSRSQSGGGRGVWPMLGWAMLIVGMAGYKVAIVAVSQGILI